MIRRSLRRGSHCPIVHSRRLQLCGSPFPNTQCELVSGKIYYLRKEIRREEEALICGTDCGGAQAGGWGTGGRVIRQVGITEQTLYC
jgi:hypothetical protein